MHIHARTYAFCKMENKNVKHIVRHSIVRFILLLHNSSASYKILYFIYERNSPKKNKTKCPEIHCPSGLCTPRRKPAASFACLLLVSGVTLYGASAIDAFFKYGVFDVLFGRVLFLLFKKLLCSSTRVRLRPAVQRHFVFIFVRKFVFSK